MATKIYATYKEFKAREDKDLNGVSPKFAKENPNWKEDNETNIGCWNCVDCRGCVGCISCSACYDEEYEEGLTRDIPVIENIHQKVYEVASKPDALDMSEWHTCDTTHCRAGWAIHLAGEAGYKLERLTSPMRAALLIYEASSPIPVTSSDFIKINEEALKSMKKAAEAEKKLNKKKP